MVHLGRLIKWIEPIGYMKINQSILVLTGLLFVVTHSWGQRSYRQDSIQFKVYTRLYVGDDLATDSIRIKKIFCDFCSDRQLVALREAGLQMSNNERYNPKYRKPGEHRLALYIRLSKDKFKALNTIQ